MIRLIATHFGYLVDESIQPSGSFKWRGVAAQAEGLENRKLVTFSSGNHGLAVALLAYTRNSECRVVVPSWVEPEKELLLRQSGCIVSRIGDTADETEREAESIANEHGALFVHPFRSMRQIMGYCSLFAEISELFPNGAHIILPVGSGALLSAGVHFSRRHPKSNLSFVGAESDSCPSLAAALSSSKPGRIITRSAFAPGLNVNCIPHVVYDIVSQSDNVEIVHVSDADMALASQYLSQMKIPIDTAAAAGVGTALFGQYRKCGKPTVIIITGGGVEPSAAQLKEAGVIPDSSESLLSWVGAPEWKKYTFHDSPPTSDL